MTIKANDIAVHIGHVSYDTKIIDRMVLNFKSDAEGKLWFLWCSTLRLKQPENKGMSSLGKMQIEVFPEHVLKSKNKMVRKAVEEGLKKNEILARKAKEA